MEFCILISNSLMKFFICLELKVLNVLSKMLSNTYTRQIKLGIKIMPHEFLFPQKRRAIQITTKNM